MSTRRCSRLNISLDDVIHIIGRTILVTILTICFLITLYLLVASPPLNLIYKPLPAAGANSVYIPGAGFSGFWYHLGLLHAFDLYEHDFYCYSSGCLSLVLAYLNASVDMTLNMCNVLQQAWTMGNITRYEVVERFVQSLITQIPSDYAFLSRVHILVTTSSEGVQMATPKSVNQLEDLLFKTCWIPYITGNGILKQLSRTNSKEYYFDGGFSRVLHPNCEISFHIPITWKSLLYSFDPGLSHSTALEFWEMGQRTVLDFHTQQDKVIKL